MSHNRAFQQKVAEDRRLVILRFLAEDADYAMNTSLLQTALEAVGHGVSREKVNADAAWLEETLSAHQANRQDTLLLMVDQGEHVIFMRKEQP